MKPFGRRPATETPASALRQKSKAGKVLRVEPIAEEEEEEDSSFDEVCFRAFSLELGSLTVLSFYRTCMPLL